MAMTREEKREKNRLYARAYRAANSEKHQEYSRAYRAAHNKERVEYNRQYRANTPFWYRKYALRRDHNITIEDYEAMLAAQGGKCAVPTCRADKPGGKSKFFYVDHDHITKTIRGLICLRCNIMLHEGRDNKEFLLGLIEYLEKTQ